jgi:hypothetical protein
MRKATLFVAGAMLLASNAFANPDLLNREAGVQNIKYEKGVISTLIVVGKAAVPKALRRHPGRAAEYAGSRAQSDAANQFTRFLSTKCKWGKTSDGQTAVKEAAVSATDASGKETSSESSSFTTTDMTKEQMAQMAQACVSGIQVLCGGMDNSGRYTWVGAWNAKAAASIKAMAKVMNEANAEVADMGKAEKAKKDARDANEINAIKNAGKKAAAKGAAASGASNGAKNGSDPDILQGMQKPKSTVASDANDFL